MHVFLAVHDWVHTTTQGYLEGSLAHRIDGQIRQRPDCRQRADVYYSDKNKTVSAQYTLLTCEREKSRKYIGRSAQAANPRKLRRVTLKGVTLREQGGNRESG